MMPPIKDQFCFLNRPIFQTPFGLSQRRGASPTPD